MGVVALKMTVFGFLFYSVTKSDECLILGLAKRPKLEVFESQILSWFVIYLHGFLEFNPSGIFSGFFNGYCHIPVAYFLTSFENPIDCINY